MKNVTKSHINKIVALMSVFAGVLSWFVCRYIYTTYSDKLSGPVMIGSLCAFLFMAVFLTVMLGSMVTGSFNKDSDLYEDFAQMATYFICSLIGVFVLSTPPCTTTEMSFVSISPTTILHLNHKLKLCFRKIFKSSGVPSPYIFSPTSQNTSRFPASIISL